MSLHRLFFVLLLVASMAWGSGDARAEGRSGSALRWLYKGRPLRALGVREHRTKGLVARNDAATRARAKEHGLVWVAPHKRTLKSGKVVNVKGHFRGKAIKSEKHLSKIVVADRALFSFDRKMSGQHTILANFFVQLRWQALRNEGLEARIARAEKSKDPDERALRNLLQPELGKTRKIVSRLRTLLPTLLAYPKVHDRSTVIWKQRADGRFETDFADVLKNPVMSRQEYSAYRQLLPELEARGKKDFVLSAKNRATLDADTEFDVKAARFAAQKRAGRLPADAVAEAFVWVKGKRGKSGHFRRKAGWQPPAPVNLPQLLQKLASASQGAFSADLPSYLRRAASEEFSYDFHKKELQRHLAKRNGGNAGRVLMALSSAQDGYQRHMGRLASHTKLQAGFDITYADVHAMRLRLEANPRTRATMEAEAKAVLAGRVKRLIP